jgi:hypothetical protein
MLNCNSLVGAAPFLPPPTLPAATALTKPFALPLFFEPLKPARLLVGVLVTEPVVKAAVFVLISPTGPLVLVIDGLLGDAILFVTGIKPPEEPALVGGSTTIMGLAIDVLLDADVGAGGLPMIGLDDLLDPADARGPLGLEGLLIGLLTVLGLLLAGLGLKSFTDFLGVF